MKLEFSRQFFGKNSHIKFHENPSCGSRVTCGQMDGQADIKKPTVFFFRNFVNAPKTAWQWKERHCTCTMNRTPTTCRLTFTTCTIIRHQEQDKSHTTSQAVNRRNLTARDPVRPRPVHVTVTLGQVCLRVLQFTLSVSSHQCSMLIYHQS